jgi:hypothetical protein
LRIALRRISLRRIALGRISLGRWIVAALRWIALLRCSSLFVAAVCLRRLLGWKIALRRRRRRRIVLFAHLQRDQHSEWTRSILSTALC